MPIGAYQKAPVPTSFRLGDEILNRLRKQAAREDRDVTSLVKILLADALDVREISVIKEANRVKKRLIQRRAKAYAQKGKDDASVLD